MIHIIGNLAFILVALSFMVKDMIWLRGLSVLASTCSIFYNYNVSSSPLFVPIFWNSFFMSLNFYHIYKIVKGNRSVKLNEEELELYKLQFKNLSLLEYSKLISIASWKNVRAGETFINEGQVMTDLLMIYNGHVEVWHAKKLVSELHDGQFIGEMSFLTNSTASASIIALHETKLIVWKQKELKELMKRNPSLIYSLQSIMGEQMAKSLRAKNEREAKDINPN
jgi:CRP-like cAMP-binding protein